MSLFELRVGGGTRSKFQLSWVNLWCATAHEYLWSVIYEAGILRQTCTFPVSPAGSCETPEGSTNLK